jgi:periplasmic mercuric ion binding protein
MKNLRSIFLIVAILMATFSAGYASKASNTATASYWVSIHCGSCQQKLMDNLRFEKGVKDIKVNVDTKQVDITFNTKKTDSSKLQIAIEKLGYEVRTLKPGEELKAPVASGTCSGGHAHGTEGSGCKGQKEAGHQCTGSKSAGHSCSGQKSDAPKETTSTCCGSKDPNHKCCKTSTSGKGCTWSKEAGHQCEGKSKDANTEGHKCTGSKAPESGSTPTQGHKCTQGQQ